MQAKQFFALFLLVIISSKAIIPEAQSNNNTQQYKNKIIADAVAILFGEALNDVQKGLVALTKEKTDLMLDSKESSVISMNSRNDCYSVLCSSASIRSMKKAQQAWKKSHPNAPESEVEDI